jgi:hypothetical protein
MINIDFDAKIEKSEIINKVKAFHVLFEREPEVWMTCGRVMFEGDLVFGTLKVSNFRHGGSFRGDDFMAADAEFSDGKKPVAIFSGAFSLE